MSFFSIPFLFYFLPFVLVGYYVLGIFKSKLLQNLFLLLCSLAFLFWLEPLLIPLVVVLTLFNWYMGRSIKNAIWNGKTAQKQLIAVYVINGGLFVLFQVLGALSSYDIPILGLDNWLLQNFLPPAGIAIFVLRSISYVSDVYKKRISAEKNLLKLGLYVCFFPQIVVGPLQSYKDFEPQFQHSFSSDLLYTGACRFAVGLGKKILLAGNLAVVADKAFALSSTSDSLTTLPVTMAWLGLAAFFLQIYYDFSAYSDMAVGMSNMLGFTAPENFRYPYMANSITDFWNRWLITIKKWFDRYVSRPLNRMRDENNDQMIVNTFIVFVAMGVWHKASIGILLWAFLQVLCIAIERVITYDKRSIPKLVKHFYVIVTVLISWSLLRYSNFYQTLLFMRNLFGLNQNNFTSPLALAFLREYWVFFVAALVFIFPIAPKLREKVETSSGAARAVAAVVYPILLLGVVVLCMLYIGRGLYVPTTYFSF